MPGLEPKASLALLMVTVGRHSRRPSLRIRMTWLWTPPGICTLLIAATWSCAAWMPARTQSRGWQVLTRNDAPAGHAETAGQQPAQLSDPPRELLLIQTGTFTSRMRGPT